MKNIKIIDWNTYFMSLAKLSALRSKDPNTQVGACIINEEKRIISLGYNGMPLGNDESFPWERDNKANIENKYAYVIHAEINAILNSNIKLNDKNVLYVSLFPCSNCAKIIVQCGIKKIYYESNKYAKTDDAIISKKILDEFKIELIQMEEKIDIDIHFSKNEM